ncbi:hypothetical protein PI124_g532 [Phytophthora idaei]|nr:hypothetical protein PI125_g4252 [Phytophthora idaei]KAG3254876.1 hypothetical protein PI124_g532 [Phytophthora idaei]
MAKRPHTSELDAERPFKLTRTTDNLRRDTINNLATLNRSMEDEIEIILQDLREAQATTARLRQRLSTREMFGSDAEDSESDTDEDKDPCVAWRASFYQTPLVPTFASRHAMSSQNEWNELEARYATPPAAEERSSRSRRRANRQRVRLRLQQRQVRRRIEDQESAAVAAREEPVPALTQAKSAMLSRRHATPSTGEDPAARRRRLANRRRAQRRLESRAAARRLDTDGGVAESALQPPIDGMSTGDAQLQSRQGQDRSDALPANMARSTTSPYSYE